MTEYFGYQLLPEELPSDIDEWCEVSPEEMLGYWVRNIDGTNHTPVLLCTDSRGHGIFKIRDGAGEPLIIVPLSDIIRKD